MVTIGIAWLTDFFCRGRNFVIAASTQRGNTLILPGSIASRELSKIALEISI